MEIEPMRRMRDFFEDYEEEKIFHKIQELIFMSLNNTTMYELFKENIKRKIWSMLVQTQFYIIEDNYTETEWKDMISEHYIHTRYKYDAKVIRVHLFNAENNVDKSYLGYFTLRKINNNGMILSFIYPNWNVLSLEERNFKNVYLITAKRKIHIYADEIEIATTPFFIQDGAVTCCAHANILMMFFAGVLY